MVALAISMHEWTNIANKLTPSPAKRSGLIALGAIYILLPIAILYQIETGMGDNGKYWILFLFISIWSSHSLAYVMGKNIGGPKMAPNISPNKTWSGYIGALIGPAIALLICTQFITPTPSLLVTALFGVFIGISGQAGDLLESLMKRKAGVKDSGNLIPGHGGLLDRIDALLLATPVYYMYLKLIYPEY